MSVLLEQRLVSLAAREKSGLEYHLGIQAAQPHTGEESGDGV
jgi:hypothetical protein